MSERPQLDAVVVGGGPAGLSAAGWLARYRRRTLVLDAGPYRSRWTEETHGYLGLDPVSPSDLRQRGLEGLGRYPWVEVREGRVVSASRQDEDLFVVETEQSRTKACRIVLATGCTDELPPIDGILEHFGSGVFNCPICDGYESRGRSVVVLGWGEDVAHTALSLLDWAAAVTLVGGASIPAEERDHLGSVGVRVEDEMPAALVGSRGALSAVELQDGSTVEADLAFIPSRPRPNVELAERLGCALTDEGCVEVDEHARTSVKSVFAAGDITPARNLVQIAAAQGATAGISCALSLRGHPGATTSPRPAPR